MQMARVLLDKEFQRDLSMISGAAPVRVDISTKGFDSCTKKNVHDLPDPRPYSSNCDVVARWKGDA